MKMISMQTPQQDRSRVMFTATKRKLSTYAIRFALGMTVASLLLESAAAQNAYFQHNLVSDIPGLADKTDTNLLNPWGIAFSATSPFWVADNHAGVSTLYDGNGTPQSLIVTIPPPSGGTPPAAPTGVVFNNTTGFVVASNAVARFIFATEDGTIVGWNVATGAAVKADNSASGAIYKGLAIGNSGGSNYIYAANFHAGTVDVFDANYSPATLAGSFTDPGIPAGFAPFNVQNVNGQLFVTYAKQDANKEDDVPGPGNGYVNVFDTSGNLIKRFASTNALNSPWGIALAPSGFGAFGGALLIGNFGNGRINAFDPSTGAELGGLNDASSAPISIVGLWGIVFGNGGNGGDPHTLYFAAGIAGPDAIEDHGLFGSLTPQFPSFTSVADKGLAEAMSWAGGVAPFLLQKKASLSDSNWLNVLTTQSRSTTIAKDSQAGFFRLQTPVTNTVVPFTVYLDGASEVPPVDTPAIAVGTLALEGSNLTYNIYFSGLSAPATAAHIHVGANPTNTSNTLIPLSVPSATAGTMSGTKLLTQDQVAAIVNGMTYINIHNNNHPGGEIRGQIVPLHTTVTLNGASEVPPVTTSATGSGSLTLIGSQLLYDISYSGLAGPATAAHIHGPADTTQPANVLVPLNSPTGTSGTISGTVSLTPTVLTHLLAGLTYINIHSTTNTGGEIRGQIFPFQLGVTMNGPSEAPTPTVTPGTGSGLMNLVNSVLTYNISYTNLLSAATAFHIHGPADTTHAAGVLFPLSGTSGTSGTLSGTQTLTSQQLFYLVTGLTYANIHTTNYPGGEIRGQVMPRN